MMRSTVRLLGAALLGAVGTGAAAADSPPVGPGSAATPGTGPAPAGDLRLDRLLDRLGPGASEIEAVVEVAAWIEPAGAGASEVVLSLTPVGGAKLVADPGITVTPVVEPGGGVAWRMPLPYHLVDADAQYFAEPPLIRLPVAGREAGPIDLDVEYAYCVVDYICLFGAERVTAALRPDPAGPLSR